MINSVILVSGPTAVDKESFVCFNLSYNSCKRYPASSWFLLRKRERYHREQPSAFPSSLREFGSRPMCYNRCQFHLSIIFRWKCLYKRMQIPRQKALTKERSKPSSKYCIYLVCGLHIKPKIKAFSPSLVRDF